jgi:hypothetical protein
MVADRRRTLPRRRYQRRRTTCSSSSSRAVALVPRLVAAVLERIQVRGLALGPGDHHRDDDDGAERHLLVVAG